MQSGPNNEHERLLLDIPASQAITAASEAVRMGEWSIGMGATMGAVLSASGYFEVSYTAGASGLHAGVEERRPRGRRIEVRHKSLTISGQVRDIERATREELEDLDLFPRPATRGECIDMPRPCPYVSCRHHLYVVVNPDTGSVQYRFGAKEIDEVPETCALDVAERGDHTLEEVGEIMNFTKERVRQIERRALILTRANGSPTMLCSSSLEWMG